MKYAIFSCTKNKKEITQLYKSTQKILEFCNESFDVIFAENNEDGLSKKYNEFLKQNLNIYDIIVFVHDDVYIDDCFIFRKLNKLHDKFDIVGLAGGVDMKIKEPALWHLMCGGFGPNLRGAVSHFYNEHAIGITPFGPTPAPVEVVDGLFISVLTKKIKEYNWQFNENYKFHHYDIASCIDATKKGMSLGIGPIWVIHQSPGLRSLSEPAFVESQNQFLKEYK
jgi:hypothetical protein